jgi:hypothetical protein
MQAAAELRPSFVLGDGLQAAVVRLLRDADLTCKTVFPYPVEEFARCVGSVSWSGGQPLVDGVLGRGGQGEFLLPEPGQEVEGGADAGAQPVPRAGGERSGSGAVAGAAQQRPVHVGAHQVCLLGGVILQ